VRLIRVSFRSANEYGIMRIATRSRAETSNNPHRQATTATRTILLVDSEPETTEMVGSHLRLAGFQVLMANDAETGLEIAHQESPDLAILDLTLPGMSGNDFCKTLKQEAETCEIQLIVLTARSEEIDRIVAFEIGVDDYVTKPFSPRELVYRVHSVLRRSVAAPAKSVVTVGPITLDHGRCHVRVDGKVIHLTPKEFKMLSLLAERPGIVQRRETLLCQVWGDEDAIEGRSVDTYLRRLRAKLGPAADCIKTVYGFGYRLAV